MEKRLKVHDREGKNEWDVLAEAGGLYRIQLEGLALERGNISF